MKRVAIIFDTVNQETGAPCRKVKIWNADETIIKHVNDYMDLHKDVEQSYCRDLKSLDAENPVDKSFRKAEFTINKEENDNV